MFTINHGNLRYSLVVCAGSQKNRILGSPAQTTYEYLEFPWLIVNIDVFTV